jgi:hypothetical protein
MKNENPIPESRVPDSTGSPENSSIRKLASDPNSSQLLNFQFALVASAVFMIGLGLFAWGIWLTTPPLAAFGFVVLLIGGWLCGCALSSE